ncbi:MAG: hypothetical protein KDB40_08205 [Acidimicrobiales bacterium]|nr:hypothetical protein [Acidimicrobiales bacterium]MCB9393247.1 hypothetical protein [Acidimicrobiaceae bacterium]
MDVHERRRLVLATAFTIVALPAIWLFDRDDPAATPGVAAAGLPAPVVSESPVTITTEPELPVFLDNTVVVVAPAVIDVAIPDAKGPNVIEGSASYKRFPPETGDRKCSAPGVPSGVAITITNIDNGLSLTCRNTNGVAIPYGIAVGIDTDLFIQIADLGDSPIPIRLSY